MIYRLFLDDERFPIGDDWVIARSYQEAIDIVLKRGCPSFMSLDHDLGEQRTGLSFVKTLCDFLQDGIIKLPTDFGWYVHSQNPVGAQNISFYLNGFLAFWGEEQNRAEADSSVENQE